jgi:hypothetical protein
MRRHSSLLQNEFPIFCPQPTEQCDTPQAGLRAATADYRHTAKPINKDQPCARFCDYHFS